MAATTVCSTTFFWIVEDMLTIIEDTGSSSKSTGWECCLFHGVWISGWQRLDSIFDDYVPWSDKLGLEPSYSIIGAHVCALIKDSGWCWLGEGRGEVHGLTIQTCQMSLFLHGQELLNGVE